MLLFIWTAIIAPFLCAELLSGAKFYELGLHCCMVVHKAACHTLSNAFSKSVKTWYKSCWCWRYYSHRILKLKICSEVLIPALSIACSAAIILSAWGFSLFKIHFRMTDELNGSVGLAALFREWSSQRLSPWCRRVSCCPVYIRLSHYVFRLDCFRAFS